jgi:hypothetical protein
VRGLEAIASTDRIGHVAPPWSASFRPGATAPLGSEGVKGLDPVGTRASASALDAAASGVTNEGAGADQVRLP